MAGDTFFGLGVFNCKAISNYIFLWKLIFLNTQSIMPSLVTLNFSAVLGSNHHLWLSQIPSLQIGDGFRLITPFQYLPFSSISKASNKLFLREKAFNLNWNPLGVSHTMSAFQNNGKTSQMNNLN